MNRAILLTRNLSYWLSVVWCALKSERIVEDARRYVVGACDVSHTHPAMNRFVAMMRPVGGVANSSKSMQTGDS